MKSHFFLIIFIFIVSSKICIAQVEPIGLQGQTITSLSAVPLVHPNPWELNICAGTNGNGVFVRDFSLPDTNWIGLGLSGRIITAITIQHWGAGPGEFNTVYAGVQPDFAGGDSTIIYKRIIYGFDTTWTPADTGLTYNPNSQIQRIESFHYGGHEPMLPIILIYSFNVYRFSLFHPVWFLLLSNDEWKVLAISQRYWTGVIWVGGETVNAEPVLAKSLNFGNSWEFFLLNAFENNATALAIDPIDNDIVYVALGGILLKTTNGGGEWFPTGLENPIATFTSIVINPTNNKQLLIGGAAGENNFILYESNNGGSRWHKIQPDSSLPGISGIVADSINNEFFVYIGTLGNGVYLYKTPVTSIDEELNEIIPVQFRLYQNYPNPFNPATRIKYSLPIASLVTLKVYDVLGNVISTIINEVQEADEYSIEFSADGLSSGIYFYRIQAGSFVEIKKMILLR